ncbi:Proline synthetase [Wickerhamomyces ciferrii]|uniref:Pyridoxal phosphate homeostasis protein n=1 Tax=Wickerhamomyces ciferrii (strain ATCC 14091 / BCRC 22168 / CBS 111 / JCM 3599 / NBRC 0793 / NRRL Y-1031 F-60-10) TaxID=1206466 RepID=K0KTV3_WICCF|nr:Proline synthetase [Wickerhamomyces ciferrii]CCH44809.1 Proline synthetase [Wickerhamomyces ciferrii]
MSLRFFKSFTTSAILYKSPTRIMSLEEPSTARVQELIANYDSIYSKVQESVKSRPDSINHPVELVAVSKYKPASDIKALYDHGVRHFGENYTQELISKASILPKDIKWHFIGGLQSNKCKDLSNNIENLHSVETIDSLKKAKKLNDSRSGVNGSIINIYLQINASNESQKSGLKPDDFEGIDELIQYITKDAKSLNLEGLMGIASYEQSTSEGENKDFKVLVELQKQLNTKYNLNLKLSMGMTADFEEAIRQGTSYVRIGSAIFGSRLTKDEIKEQK